MDLEGQSVFGELECWDLSFERPTQRGSWGSHLFELSCEPREKPEAPSWPSKEQRVWVLRTEKSNLHSLMMIMPLKHVGGKGSFVFAFCKDFLPTAQRSLDHWNSMSLILLNCIFLSVISAYHLISFVSSRSLSVNFGGGTKNDQKSGPFGSRN